MMRIIYLTSRLDEYYNTSPEMGISVTYFDMKNDHEAWFVSSDQMSDQSNFLFFFFV